MVRVIATFFAVWLAIGAIGVLIQGTIIPISNTAVSLIGLAIATAAAFVVYRRRNRQSRGGS
jgi:LPXTG-motif cell wall-anchored protein